LSLSVLPKREMNPDTLPFSTANCTTSPSRTKEYMPEGSSADAEGFAFCWGGDAAVTDSRAGASVHVTAKPTNNANPMHLAIMVALMVNHHCTPPWVGERATSPR
jgi:hypothetical protein